jgi:hypothetical protein
MRALALALALTAASPARADDIPDYDPASTAWNGLRSFVGLAEGMGFEVETVAALEWNTLSDKDILVLLYPLRRVDPNRLDAFIQAGGHAMIADDFGAARDAVTRLQMIRAEVGAPDAATFHGGRAYAPIARPLVDHPIAAQVTEVVTNHPTILTRVEGATSVIGFSATQSIVVAGQRGTGRFVVVSDPSVFINLMQEFGGNAQLSANILRWLDRRGRARRVVILRGDVPMYGDPRPFIDDAGAGKVGRAVADLNDWLGASSLWLLTPNAMRVVAAVLALALVALVLFAMPFRRKSTVDGSWLRFVRPGRRDAPDKLIVNADRGDDNFLTAACVLRDLAQSALARTLDKADPIYTMTEAELVDDVRRVRGLDAGDAAARVYRRLRALPSRGQAAAPWGGGQLVRREFDRLHSDVADLCRTLGEEIV